MTIVLHASAPKTFHPAKPAQTAAVAEADYRNNATLLSAVFDAKWRFLRFVAAFLRTSTPHGHTVPAKVPS